MTNIKELSSPLSQRLMQFAPLPIRIVAGLSFILHGIPKFQSPDQVAGFFGQIGLPAEMVIPIGLLEVIGGIFILIGFMTRISGILLAIDMIGATLLAKFSRGFIGGFELEMLLMAISIALLVGGPGKYSVEHGLLKREIFAKGRILAGRP